MARGGVSAPGERSPSWGGVPQHRGGVSPRRGGGGGVPQGWAAVGFAGPQHLPDPHPVTLKPSPLPPLPPLASPHPQPPQRERDDPPPKGKRGPPPPPQEVQPCLTPLLPPQPRVELAWAMKAHQHAQVYFNLISSVDPKFLNLTKVDDQIYSEFRKSFKDLKIDVLDPEELKSESAKEKWRPFCLRFEGVVEDFNYGTLLRLDCRKDYTEENTIFATRIQFFAIEIARNREGCNSVVYSSAREPAAAAAEEAASG
uniref:Polysaccharide biosynthesis domain containing 1 n=1 Tax=Aquila chrysaetos chrysaetos TaxID=223781 RepID=A0A663E8M0_AQUCH